MTPWDPLGAWPSWRRRLWAGLAVVAVIAWLPVFWASLRPSRDVFRDFFQEWASARNRLVGLPVYSSHHLTFPRHTGENLPRDTEIERNAHPPTSVLLVLPFGLLAYRDALLAWNLTSLAMLWASLWVVKRQLEVPLSWWSVFPAMVLLLSCGPLTVQLFQGQLNLVLMLLITGVWAAGRSGRPFWAGAFLGTATAVKLFPGFLFLYFILSRRWRVVLAGLLSCAALTVLTAAVLGPESYRAYARDVLPGLRTFWSDWPNASLVGFWFKLFDPATGRVSDRVEPLWRSATLARLGALASCAAVVAVLAAVVPKARSSVRSDHAFGLAVTSMLLVSPVTWDHSLLLLLVPVASLWVALPPSGVVRGLFMGALAAVWAWPFVVHDAFIPGGRLGGLASPVQALTVLSFQCYALIVLFGLGVLATLRGWGEAR
jgi:hypothetical protein